jgi:hypothetical protein
MPHTPAWYPGKPETVIDDKADTLEVLALDPRKAVLHETTLTCPSCGFRKDETMPEDQCVYFYTCTHCGKVLKPIFGDCCVFCSYGSLVCPSEQRRALDDTSQSIRRHVGQLREAIEPREKE